jgi:hypothetical protein
MAPGHNKAVVQAFIEAVNHQDWLRLDDLLVPHFVRHSGTSGQPQIRSCEQLRDFLVAEEAVTFPGGHEDIHFLIAGGAQVFTRGLVARRSGAWDHFRPRAKCYPPIS